MSKALLTGVRVIDAAGEPAAIAGRILADLGAAVVKVEPPQGDALRAAPPFAPGASDASDGEHSLRFAAWNAGKSGLACTADDPRLAELLAGADIVIDTPGWPAALELDPAMAPQAVWVHVTPFGQDGPRARWRASDLGVMASSGNMNATGDPDRAPLRCSEPTAYAHVGPEVAFAALTGLASGRPQSIDVSMQEVVVVANMSGPAQTRQTGILQRRIGASMGRTREIWPCKDGFVSFGLRGGRARVPSLELLTRLLQESGLATPAWTERDWSRFDPVRLGDEELRAIEEPLGRYFASRTMSELHATACETNLMLAPACSPREIYDSAQGAARGVFGTVGRLRGFPWRMGLVRSASDGVESLHARTPAPRLASTATPRWAERQVASRSPHSPRGAWEGVKIVELGAGAAGPIASRYFAEHGATVVKIESRTRPEFLRMMWAAQSPHGVEGSPLFDALNPGKHSVALNLKSPGGVATAKRLFAWADVVLENFAPRAMRGFGLDYDTLVRDIPDLLMISTCLNGQTGPHRDYPGFGGQGSALAGFNFLTGWPDRAPLGPFGTITDSLAPRFTAACLAAALLHRRRTGRGLHMDLAQVELGQYALAPWLLDFANNGHVGERLGNRSRRAAPHGAFPCVGDDRWVAVAVWSDDEWARLAAHIGVAPQARWDTLAGRLEHVDEVEAVLAVWTQKRTREQVADELQAIGIEAVPVADFRDVLDDPQLAARGHYVEIEHPVLGSSFYERNGMRLGDADAGYARPSPMLGQHNDEVLRGLLGIAGDELERLIREGAVEEPDEDPGRAPAADA